MSACAHKRKALYRHPYGDVGLFHVLERCAECGLRTHEGWVPQATIRNAIALPIDPYLHGRDPRQGGLF